MEKQFLPYSLHVALATYPLGKDDKYVRCIENIYSNYKDNFNQGLKVFNAGEDEKSEELAPFLYKPLKFHLLGHYDIAYISLLDSYGFAQKVFESMFSSKKEQEDKTCDESFTKPSSYQILTGSILKLNNHLKVEKYFDDFDFDFVQIMNLKLNNGLLIGNGSHLLLEVINKIDDLLFKKPDTNYLIVNSFNWCELTVIVFSKKIQILTDSILEIRKLTLADLFSGNKTELCEQIIDNCLFSKYEDEDKIFNSHVVSDTQSYFGLNYDKLQKNEIDFHNNNLMSIIEYQVSPGHLPYLKAGLFKSNPDLFEESVHFKNGKTDFYFKEKEYKSLKSNLEIYKGIRNNKELIKHFRKLKTNPLFHVKEEFTNIEECTRKEKNPEEVDIIDIQKILKKNTFNIELAKIREDLKKLKLSRQVRDKVLKVYHNYNAGILDPISYIYFIDFKEYLKYFITIISEFTKNVDSVINDKGVIIKDTPEMNPLNNSHIENQLGIFIEAFEEAYYNRVLNNYFYEDINDFSIDFNSSITQILTSYDSVIKLLSMPFQREDPHILVRQNDINTESNMVSINYNSYHLLEPSLVFSTVAKELANAIPQLIENKIKVKSNFQILINGKKLIFNDLKGLTNINYLEDITKIFDFEYFHFDVIKYYHTYNANTELYVYWSWLYMLQNTSMYSTVGYVEEEKFQNELFRILLVVYHFDSDFITDGKMQCPIPELYDYWERYYDVTLRSVGELEKSDTFVKLKSIIIEEYIERILLFDSPEIDINNTENMNDDRMRFIFNHRFSNSSPGKNAVKKISDYDARDEIKNRYAFIECFSSELIPCMENGEICNYNEKDHFSTSLYFNCISYAYLSWIFRKTGGKIHLLRRNWANGEPILDFVQLKNNEFLLIDPHGGFYSTNIKSGDEHNLFKNSILHALWHLGLVNKINLFSPLTETVPDEAN
jgi:hypothetical protein